MAMMFRSERISVMVISVKVVCWLYIYVDYFIGLYLFLLRVSFYSELYEREQPDIATIFGTVISAIFL